MKMYVLPCWFFLQTDESSSQSSGIVGSLVRRNSIHIDRDLLKNGIQSPIYEVPSPKPNFPSPTSESELMCLCLKRIGGWDLHLFVFLKIAPALPFSMSLLTG